MLVFLVLERFINIIGLVLFEKCITNVSVYNMVFRTRFLQPEIIALIPHNCYNLICESLSMAEIHVVL